MAFKATLLLFLLIPALSISYYFGVALPAQNKAALEFEKQKYADQQAKEKASEDRAASLAAQRDIELNVCLSDAESTYQLGLKNNGTKNANGTYTLIATVAEGLQRRREGDITECHRKYGK